MKISFATVSLVLAMFADSQVNRMAAAYEPASKVAAPQADDAPDAMTATKEKASAAATAHQNLRRTSNNVDIIVTLKPTLNPEGRRNLGSDVKQTATDRKAAADAKKALRSLSRMFSISRTSRFNS